MSIPSLKPPEVLLESPGRGFAESPGRALNTDLKSPFNPGLQLCSCGTYLWQLFDTDTGPGTYHSPGFTFDGSPSQGVVVASRSPVSIYTPQPGGSPSGGTPWDYLPPVISNALYLTYLKIVAMDIVTGEVTVTDNNTLNPQDFYGFAIYPSIGLDLAHLWNSVANPGPAFNGASVGLVPSQIPGSISFHHDLGGGNLSSATLIVGVNHFPAGQIYEPNLYPWVGGGSGNLFFAGFNPGAGPVSYPAPFTFPGPFSPIYENYSSTTLVVVLWPLLQPSAVPTGPISVPAIPLLTID